MTALIALALLFAPPAPLTLDQIRADPNAEHRSHAAVEYALAAEHNAEAAYSRGETAGLKAELQNMADAVEVAKKALEETGKTPMKHPSPYKFGELKTQEILVRLGHLENKMDIEERPLLQGPKTTVQEIHDAWFDGIMSKKK